MGDNGRLPTFVHVGEPAFADQSAHAHRHATHSQDSATQAKSCEEGSSGRCENATYA